MKLDFYLQTINYPNKPKYIRLVKASNLIMKDKKWYTPFIIVTESNMYGVPIAGKVALKVNNHNGCITIMPAYKDLRFFIKKSRFLRKDEYISIENYSMYGDFFNSTSKLKYDFI